MIKEKLELKKNRIRAFFFSLEKKEKEKGDYQDFEAQIEEEGMIYVQMRLPVEKITPEFEESLKKKIAKNFLKANIREADQNDLDSIVSLYNKAWLTSQTPFRPLDKESLEKVFEDPDTVILIAKVYGMDAGFVILDFEGKNKDIGIIAGLGVLPRFQRKGLGTVLGMATWNYFKKEGVKELRCEVYKDNNVSYSFLKWIGFEEYDRKAYKKEDFELDKD